MRAVIAIVGTCAALGLAACGQDEDPQEAASKEATQSADASTGDDRDKVDQGPRGADGGGGGNVPEKPGVEIATGDSEFGTILFDGDDQAIYLFDKETSERSECYGACAEAWPPVIAGGEPQAGKGVDAQLLGTTERDDGSAQVTYDGHPLYYYVDDPPGQVLCHDVVEFGGLWLVVQPNGDAVL